MKSQEVNFWYWLVDKLPNKLVYFCFMKVWSFSTTEKFENTLTEKVSCSAAITRFSEKHKIKF